MSLIFSHPDGQLWAPDVHYDEATDGFYLYYTVNGRIGVAEADSPLGPFTSVDDNLVANAIDAHLFRDDDGSLYLYYAAYVESGDDIDPSVGFESLWVQPMRSFTEPEGEPTLAVRAPEGSWKWPIVEAPWMFERDGTYYLSYSGNLAPFTSYAVGYATSSSPLGPFTEAAENPIAAAHDNVYGPGHHAVVTDDAGQLWMVYHQKTREEQDWGRSIAIDRMWFDGDLLRVQTTRGSEQPGPTVK